MNCGSRLSITSPASGRASPACCCWSTAHTLPYRLLEELRLITNLVRDGQSRVQLILAGGPVLEERFAHPKLDSFGRRPWPLAAI